MNFRITFLILFTIAIVSVIFSTTMDVYISIYDPNWNGLFSKNIDDSDKKRIFLIGSSTVYSIDSSYINNKFSINEKNYELYNLADMSDTPHKRLLSINNIISNNPETIIYGIDVQNYNQKTPKNSTISELILHPKTIFNDIFFDIIDTIKEKIPGSPKDRSLLTLKYILFGPQPHHHPFINFAETPITPINELKNYTDSEFYRLDLSKNNKQIIALQQIVNELKKNDIKVILFSTPYAKIPVSQEDVEHFEKMLNDFSQENNVPVYYLHEKYVLKEIWRDNIHVAVNNDTKIYSNDIFQILLKELNNSAI